MQAEQSPEWDSLRTQQGGLVFLPIILVVN